MYRNAMAGLPGGSPELRARGRQSWASQSAVRGRQGALGQQWELAKLPGSHCPAESFPRGQTITDSSGGWSWVKSLPKNETRKAAPQPGVSRRQQRTQDYRHGPWLIGQLMVLSRPILGGQRARYRPKAGWGVGEGERAPMLSLDEYLPERVEF